MLRKLLVVVLLAAGGISSGSAGADVGTLAASEPPGPVGRCVSAFAAAGVGGTDGLQYEIEGVGASPRASTVATQVECKFYDLDTNSDLVVFQSGYMSGPVADLADVYTVRTLDTFITCARVDTFDSSGHISSTPWTTTDNEPCSAGIN